jgi:hypothetical protein
MTFLGEKADRSEVSLENRIESDFALVQPPEEKTGHLVFNCRSNEASSIVEFRQGTTGG